MQPYDMKELEERVILVGVQESFSEFVTKTVEEDGIAFAMKHYGLI